MLDDLNYVAQKDPQDMLGIMLDGVSQLKHTFDLTGKALPKKEQVDNVVVLGMGGSALAAEYMRVWPGLHIPFEICRQYTVPLYVNERSLVIVSSYSGNTEETLDAMEDAQKKGARLAVVTSGGMLLERAKAQNLPCALIPDGEQPRACVFYDLKALMTILQAVGLYHGATVELSQVADTLAHATEQWGPHIPTKSNTPKKLAEEMVGKTPVIYGGILYAAAYKWKINCNENAKNLAFCNQMSEFDHNEFLGWTSHPIEKPFVVFDLISSFDHPEIQKRFVLGNKLLSGMRPEAIEIQAQGSSLLEQLIWVTLLGDVTSVYLAILNGVNPTPVDLVEKLKKELREL